MVRTPTKIEKLNFINVQVLILRPLQAKRRSGTMRGRKSCTMGLPSGCSVKYMFLERRGELSDWIKVVAPIL